MQLDDYPFTFAATPVFLPSAISGANGAIVCANEVSTTKPPQVYLIRPGAVSSAANVVVSGRAEGTWK